MANKPRREKDFMKLLFHIDKNVHEELRKLAFERRRPMAEMIREAVDQWLNRQKHKKGGGR
jgi:predicted transcriptional regulator